MSGANELAKAEGVHPPAGYEPIPGGRHGGYRKREGRDYVYWYPNAQAHSDRERYERDPSRRPGVADLKPHDLVEVGGRRGYYRYQPEHEPPAPAGQAWVTHVGTGEHEFVRADTIHPMRVKAAAPPPPPPKPRAAPPTAPARAVPPPPPPKGAYVTPTPLPASNTPHPEAQRGYVYADSRAKPGTVLHDMENGGFMLGRFKSTKDNAWRDGTVVPRERQREFLEEFRPLVEGAAKRIAKRYHISISDAHGGKSVRYEELVAGAYVGLVESLRTYKGGAPYLQHAQDYANVAALREARNEMGAGAKIPDRQMRTLGGFVAARTRARARFNTADPTPAQVAQVWTLRKKDVYTGDPAYLGRYVDEDGVGHDQAEEEVPDTGWKIRTPDGTERGEEHPGKVALVGAMGELVQAGRVEDGEWLVQHEANLLPGHSSSSMPLGTALHVRSEVDDVLSGMRDRERVALEMKFGMHSEDGEPASVEEIANAVGIDPEKAAPTKRKEVAALLDAATATFRQRIEAKRGEAARHAARWAEAAKIRTPADAEVMGPSGAELADRFGSSERVSVYMSAIRAGHGARTGAVLEREKAGTATPEETEAERRAYHENRRRERLAAWDRHRAVEVDPKLARDFGPTAGTPAESDWLYPDTVLHDYMHAVARTGRG